MAHVVEPLPSKHKALNLISVLKKKVREGIEINDSLISKITCFQPMAFRINPS
jgi:hypothetical protein